MGALLPQRSNHAGIGGERGIRTLEGLLTLTPLAGVRLRPLGHLSGADPTRVGRAGAARILARTPQVKGWRVRGFFKTDSPGKGGRLGSRGIQRTAAVGY